MNKPKYKAVALLPSAPSAASPCFAGCWTASAVNHDPDNLIRTQDLEPWFEENSNLYIFNRDSFAKTKARIGKQPMMFEGPAFESIDIDTPQDWDFAVAAARFMQEQAAKAGAA
jgi:CMP-N-acetylneuraminic acid synthetase